MSKPRDTRLLNKSTFDDPDEFCEAGSNNEADIIAEWQRWELVDKIQELDQKLFDKEQAYDVLLKQAEELAKEIDLLKARVSEMNNSEKTEFKKARDEASANYQISNPDFCGVDIAKHKSFQKGADWAYEWLVKDRFINPIKKQIDQAEKIMKQQAIIDMLKEALELLSSGKFYDLQSEVDKALADVKEMEKP
jgi:hypothetical protein